MTWSSRARSHRAYSGTELAFEWGVARVNAGSQDSIFHNEADAHPYARRQLIG